MKQYTQEEFNNFARDELGYLQCPSGDYRLIKKFPEYCSFGEDCSFGEQCRFGGYCSFGKGCGFGEWCSFGKQCSFGGCCNFGKGCSFSEWCSFGERCSFGGCCSFGEWCGFGEGCGFGEWCRFGEQCIFAEGCACEEGYRFKSLLTVGYLGSREGQTYFWLLEDGNILVRCGCFCGMIDDFANRVEEEHGDDVHGKMYRLAIEMARVKAGSLS